MKVTILNIENLLPLLLGLLCIGSAFPLPCFLFMFSKIKI